MKKIFYILTLIPFLALAQSQDQNYIKTTTYKKASTIETVDVTNPADAAVQVSYFDGLGRPIQQVAHKQSNSGKDIITHIEYDAFGRQTKEYMPYANGSQLCFEWLRSSVARNGFVIFCRDVFDFK